MRENHKSSLPSMLVDVEGEDGGGGEFEGTNVVTVMSYRLCGGKRSDEGIYMSQCVSNNFMETAAETDKIERFGRMGSHFNI